jgi:hypothetical protein
MTEDQTWLQVQQARFAEEIQRARYFLNDVREQREEIAGFWNDACAREINGRFLDAMASEADAALNALSSQHTSLDIARSELVDAYMAFIAATRATTSIRGYIDESAAIFRTLETFLNQSSSELDSAKSHTENAIRLVEEADRAGNSARAES